MKTKVPFLLLLGMALTTASCSIIPFSSSGSAISSTTSATSEGTSQASSPTGTSEASSESSSAPTSEQSSQQSEPIPSSESSEQSSQQSSEQSSEQSSQQSSEQSSEQSSQQSSEKSSEQSSQQSSQSSSSQSSQQSSQTSSETSTTTSSEYTSVSLPEEDTRWNLDFSTYGKTFRDSLAELIRKTGGLASSYSATLSAGAKAAAYPSYSSNTFIPFYHEAKDSEKTTTSGCNREHTWPNSRGGGDKAGGGEIEKDPIMVRPTLTKDNSDRGNNFYGTGSNEWDPADCGYEGARGESARIILYVATCYGSSHGLSLSNNPKDSSSMKTMGTLKTLLQWNRTYQPTAFEKTVNDRYENMGYRRNPFVDHPEYAEWIWDDNGLRTSAPADIDPPVDSSSSAYSGKLYDLADVTDMTGKKVVITTGAKMLCDRANKDTTPWYLASADVGFYQGKLVDDDSLVWFTVESGSTSGTLRFKTSSGKYLYGYTAGTYYSIMIAKDEAEAAQLDSKEKSYLSNEWKATSDSSGQKLASGTVNLNFSDKYGTWQGSSSAASLKIFAQA